MSPIKADEVLFTLNYTDSYNNNTEYHEFTINDICNCKSEEGNATYEIKIIKENKHFIYFSVYTYCYSIPCNYEGDTLLVEDTTEEVETEYLYCKQEKVLYTRNCPCSFLRFKETNKFYQKDRKNRYLVLKFNNGASFKMIPCINNQASHDNIKCSVKWVSPLQWDIEAHEYQEKIAFRIFRLGRKIFYSK